MKIRAKNTVVDPVYWAHLRKWPIGQVMEYEVSEHEYAEIKADARITIEELSPSDAVVLPFDLDAKDDETPVERRAGRPKKAK